MPSLPTRLGYHYYPDTLHYRQHDLQTWLPELKQLGANWLTLLAPVERAIPEFFLKGLIDAGIQPVLHFRMPVSDSVDKDDLKPLFHTYARWGVRYITLFDCPNSRFAWSPTTWVQTDLVERFLDIYLPLAKAALQEGLIPVFPPLKPGGDYWDLAFLETALRSLQRRKETDLLDKLVLGAYAWVGEHPLDWGTGGPERWPGARPYYTPPGVQDHLGFRIFEWYQAIAQEVLDTPSPIILLKAGSWLPMDEGFSDTQQALALHSAQNLAVARLMSGDDGEVDPGEGLAEEPLNGVLACNLWLLTADQGSPNLPQAWFRPDGERLPVVDEIRSWIKSKQGPVLEVAPPDDTQVQQVEDNQGEIAEAINVGTKYIPELEPSENISSDASGGAPHLIDHYILLPLFAWGAADWELDLIKRVYNDAHPTVGFSISEARLARLVTVVGGEGSVSEDVEIMLELAGCSVERMTTNGTLIAS